VGLTTPALLPNSPKQEGRRSLWLDEKLNFHIHSMLQKKSISPWILPSLLFLVSLLIDKHMYIHVYELPYIHAFYNLFILYSPLSITLWHRLVNHQDQDTLPMIHIYAMFVAGDFLPKKNMIPIGYSIRSCHQHLVLWT
jgi:hypothetical protein